MATKVLVLTFVLKGELAEISDQMLSYYAENGYFVFGGGSLDQVPEQVLNRPEGLVIDTEA